MVYLLKNDKGKAFSLRCKESSADNLKALSSKLSQKIVKKIIEKKEAYPKQLAKYLGIHEQKVYYHIKKLEKAEIIKKSKIESINGVPANYYKLSSPSFVITLEDNFKEYNLKQIANKDNEFFKPFIENGELNSLIITGSHLQHGKHNARSRDTKPTTEIALLIGSYLSNRPNKNKFKIDTQIKEEDLKENMILIGGPIVNTISGKINEHLPIKFTKSGIYSSCSKKTYSYDETGMIVKIKNPFNKDKRILVIAGNTHMGTKACITALYDRFEEVSTGNRNKPRINAKIIEGIDTQGDGNMGASKILE